RGPGLLQDLGGLFLSEPEQLLDARAEPGVGGAFLLLDLAVRVGQLSVQRLDLFPVLAQFAVDLLEMLVGLVRVVSAHAPREVALRGLLEEVAELGNDVGLHFAKPWGRRGADMGKHATPGRSPPDPARRAGAGHTRCLGHPGTHSRRPADTQLRSPGAGSV